MLLTYDPCQNHLERSQNAELQVGDLFPGKDTEVKHFQLRKEAP